MAKHQAFTQIWWVTIKSRGIALLKKQALLSRLAMLAPVSLLIFLGLSACKDDATSWQRIQEAGVLRIGVDPTYPPFELAIGEELSGLDVDLARAVASDLNLKAEFLHFGYDGLYDALATGQVDVLVSALVIVPGRLRDFSYGNPYFDAGLVIVSPGKSPVNKMDDLNGKILAVELGSLGHVEATSWQRKLSQLTIKTLDKPDEAMTAVGDGLANAALTDSVSARLFLKDTPALYISKEVVSEDPYAMVVRVEDRTLLKQLNGSLQRLNSTGQLGNIISTWLDR